MSEKTVSLQIVEEAGERPWYADGLRFSCTQCGNCCSGSPGFVWLTLEDMQKIAAFLKMDFDKFTRTYVRQLQGGYSLTEKFNYDCTFLRRENGKAMCGIYPVRPMQCRTWPFWEDNLKTPREWERAGQNCPGIARPGDGAPLYSQDEIERCRNHPESPR